jgi:ATP-dependent exoDNAse (exonuclease V) beta subunit
VREPPPEIPDEAWGLGVDPEAPNDERTLHLPEALRLEQNLALLAGAGAGKTHSLVTMCLHLLSGARAERPPLPCERLGLLTFTDKAAAEMRSRLRARLDLLAQGQAEEPELRQTFTELARPFPPQAFWRATRDDLGAATIGTFHSLCTTLLRRAPAESGLDAAFELLDEREARKLVRELTERTVLERLEAGDRPLRDAVRELGFEALVGVIASVGQRLREEGQHARYVAVSDVGELRARFDTLLRRAQRLGLLGLTQVKRSTKSFEPARDFVERLSRTTFDRFAADAPRLRELWGQFSRIDALKEARACLHSGESPHPETLLELHAAVLVAPHEAAVREVMTLVEERHRELLRARGQLDFTGLLVEARDLLRDFPEARRAAQARFGALLVDEFQDTNVLQLELVMLLSEQRDGAPRPISVAFDAPHDEMRALPLQPAFLAVVGDRKQAIYEFRGADVSVFEAIAQRIEASGGGRAWLSSSRRSSPALVGALNALMPGVLGRAVYPAPPQPFEVLYEARRDDLSAVRTLDAPGTPLVQLVDPDADGPAAARRLADAQAVARAVAALLAEPAQIIDRSGAPRAVRGGDVAVLFRRFTGLEAYRQALVEHGVRHRVIRGRGFFGATEVIDVASLLTLLVAPDDAVALAAVLRGPAVGLVDADLVQLAFPEGEAPRGLRGVVGQGAPWPPGLSPEGLRALEDFTTAFHAIRAERDRLGLRALLKVLYERFELRLAWAASPFGDQALANLDKLLELASARERHGVGGAAFARELLELSEEAPTEAQGEVLDELDSDVVTLLTVHQAKGLEWPIVVLPDLEAKTDGESGALRFDRTQGLALRAVGTERGLAEPYRFVRTREVRQRRAQAEAQRLLYVALTRARDRVVLGLCGPTRGNTWAKTLLAACENLSPGQRSTLDVSSLPAGRAPVTLAPPLDAAAEVSRAIERVVQPPAPQPRRVVLPVTQLQVFEECPERYHLAFQVGLPEWPGQLDWQPLAADDDEAPTDDVRARGTAAHRLLELTPLPLVGTPALDEALRRLRHSEGLAEDASDEVLGWVRAFWATPFGASLAARGEGAVHRELPFVLSLGDDTFSLRLKGQIDLLLDEGEALTVVDYKTSHPPAEGLDGYRFQLACYALAARRLAGRDVPVRAGLVFLRQARPVAQFLEGLPSVQALEETLVSAARRLVTAQHQGAWPRREPSVCRALGCGYVSRCHPGGRGV